MKRLIIITGVILTAYLIFSALSSTGTGIPDAAAADSTAKAGESGYCITALDERIAVYHNGELYLKTATPLSYLPKADRARIEKGIYVNSLKEVNSLLSDYCS